MTGPSPSLLAGQPAADGAPVFREPWEAHAFAMAVRLHEQGLFTWPQWAAAVTGLYPLTLRFPADTRAATVEGKWRRLPDGMIEATYNAQDELAWSLTAVGVDSPEIQRALG